MRHGAILGERRGLSLAGTPREIQLFLQPIVLTPQAIAFPLDSVEFTPQSLAFGFGALRPFTPVTLVLIVALGHATVMADSRRLYKYEILDSGMRTAGALVRTR